MLPECPLMGTVKYCDQSKGLFPDSEAHEEAECFGRKHIVGQISFHTDQEKQSKTEEGLGFLLFPQGIPPRNTISFHQPTAYRYHTSC